MGSFDEQPPPAVPPENASEEPDPAGAPVRRPQHRWFRLAAALVVAALAVGGIGGYTVTRNLQNGASAVSTSSASAVTTPPSGTGATSAIKRLTLSEIEAAVDPALVDITASLGGSGTAAGTGMVISS
ncbi:MAG: hypothetical protein QOF59_2958, partial [Actinomycetota bacterium]|nr:hypothetical protein [Actinomycetota bacterium]